MSTGPNSLSKHPRELKRLSVAASSSLAGAFAIAGFRLGFGVRRSAPIRVADTRYLITQKAGVLALPTPTSDVARSSREGGTRCRQLPPPRHRSRAFQHTSP